MTRVLIASRAANTLGSAKKGGHPPTPQAPRPERPGRAERVLAALTRRRNRAVAPPAGGQRARELAVSARAQR